MSENAQRDAVNKTWPDVASELLSYVFRLIDSGRIIPVIFLGLVVCAIIAVLRMDPADLGPLTQTVLHLLASRIVSAGVPSAVAVIIYLAWDHDHKTLIAEIERLGNEKSEYAHSPAIPKHSSSEYAWDTEAENRSITEAPTSNRDLEDSLDDEDKKTENNDDRRDER